jgi:hypothetical protein
MHYDIFIDESGLFTETSTDPGDRIVEHRRRKQFPSQLAGVFAPVGYLTPEESWRRLKPACEKAAVTVVDEFHSKDIKKRVGGAFDTLVVAACERLRWV